MHATWFCSQAGLLEFLLFLLNEASVISLEYLHLQDMAQLQQTRQNVGNSHEQGDMGSRPRTGFL